MLQNASKEVVQKGEWGEALARESPRVPQDLTEPSPRIYRAQKSQGGCTLYTTQ